jgi:hypothetical protein
MVVVWHAMRLLSGDRGGQKQRERDREIFGERDIDGERQRGGGREVGREQRACRASQNILVWSMITWRSGGAGLLGW